MAVYPGTRAGAVGTGQMDTFVGGVTRILIGTDLIARFSRNKKRSMDGSVPGRFWFGISREIKGRLSFSCLSS